jgi:hypothetical protein
MSKKAQAKKEIRLLVISRGEQEETNKENTSWSHKFATSYDKKEPII